ncbi:MAG TPA: rhodanese-like domain-containing protein [Pyrinomonadaceae bacterium]|jgi:rhodanese-related sulfurtransferase
MSNTKTVRDVRTISTEELAAKLNRNEKFEFWNVLTNEYYGNENIKGSRHVPLDRVGREIAELKLPADAEIVVYCAGPECPQSGAAAEKLLTYGYKNVFAYEGGLEEWEAAGLTIEAEKPAAKGAAPANDPGAHSCH